MIDPNIALEESRCSCGVGGSTADRLKLAFLERIGSATSPESPIPPEPPFDPTACAVTDLTDGGGDTFDCYDDGPVDSDLPLAGTGWNGLWILDLLEPLSIRGDDFESYSDGPVTATMAGGTGFTGFWIFDS